MALVTRFTEFFGVRHPIVCGGPSGGPRHPVSWAVLAAPPRMPRGPGSTGPKGIPACLARSSRGLMLSGKFDLTAPLPSSATADCTAPERKYA
jgi:hypothetical protein